MAVAFTNLTFGGSGTNLTIYSTASVTPTTGSLQLLHVVAVHATANTYPSTPTVTGCGLTWVLEDSVSMPLATETVLFTFRALGTASAGAISIDFGAETMTSCRWALDEASGTDTSGTNGSGAIIQSVTNTFSAATSGSVALSSFASANNATYGVIGRDTAEATTVGSGFTELVDTTGNNIGIQTQWRVDNDTSVDWTWTTADSSVAIGFEIKAAAVGGPTTDVITATGSWVAPTGVTSVDVECWGGGGGGAGEDGTQGGGGGGGGAYSKKTLAVTPGNSYTVTIGAGGAGGNAAVGATGGDSWFSTSGTVMAKGGTGGQLNNTAAAGGTTAASVGDTKFAGGQGAAGGGTNGGGGGGAANAGGAGGAGVSEGAGGAKGSGAGIGGAGGAASATGSDMGSPGTIAGGGGGGAGDSGPNNTNGSGARGEVWITYTVSVVGLQDVWGVIPI